MPEGCRAGRQRGVISHARDALRVEISCTEASPPPRTTLYSKSAFLGVQKASRGDVMLKLIPAMPLTEKVYGTPFSAERPLAN